MAKRTRRRTPRGPKGPTPVRRIPFKAAGRALEANDLDDAARYIIEKTQESYGWSQAETAANLGMTQQALNQFMSVDREAPHVEGENARGTLTVRTLSKLAAATPGAHNSPILFFQQHPLFAGNAQDAGYQALCSVLSSTEAADLAQIVEVLRGRESVAEYFARQRAMLGIDEPRTPRIPK